MLKPHKYQTRAIDLTVKHGSVYHMLDAGLGKTMINLLAAKKVGKPVLVFGPRLAIIDTWPKEIEKWVPDMSYVVLHGTNKDHRAKVAKGCDITLLNYDGWSWFFDCCNRGDFKLKKFFTIFDESSMVRWNGWETKTGRLTRFGRAVKMKPVYSAWRTCNSATPAPNSLIDIWAAYYLLDEGKRLGRSFYDFRNTFFNYSGSPFFKTTLKPGAEERIYEAIADITHQLNAEDHLQMPPLQQVVVPLTMDKPLRKLYDELDTEYYLDIEGEVVLSNSEATNYNKLRQLLQGGVYSRDGTTILLKSRQKVRYLKEFVKTSVGNPVMAAINFRFEYEQICKEFNYEVPILYGSTAASKVRSYIKNWNAGKIPLLLVHPDSVKYSLNLQSGGHTLVWLALPWSYEAYYQLLRRLYRQGQRHRVSSHAVCFEDSIDQIVAKALVRKATHDSRLKTAMGNLGLR